jgi:hypothetical protein
MPGYYGDYAAAKTVRCRFNTVNSSGVPTSLSAGAVTVTKDGADVTPSGGVALTADVGSVVGRNHVVIDMSVDPATFTAGAEYSVRLSGTANVGGTSVVGIVVGEWSVANRALGAAGLDAIIIETGLNARQALALIAAASAGADSGLDTGSIVIKGAGVATTRITATGDASGNRSSMVLTPPA